MAIRYDKQLNADIRRTVSNFNRKVSRLEKQGRELIPDKISTQELKNQFTSRYELKRKLKELQRFSTKGAEDILKNQKGIEFTNWSYDNLKREIRRAKYVAGRETRELKKEITPLTITRKSAYNNALSRLKILNRDISGLTKSELNKVTANINRILDYDNKAEQFQANFTDMIFSEYGVSNAPDYVVSGLTDFFGKLKPEQLVKLHKFSPEIQAITDYSPTKGNTVSVNRMGDILKSLYDKIPELSDIL